MENDHVYIIWDLKDVVGLFLHRDTTASIKRSLMSNLTKSKQERVLYSVQKDGYR